MNQELSTRMGAARRGVVRLVLGVALAVSSVVAVAPAVGAVPAGDPYEDISPPPSYPAPDLTTRVTFAAVYHWQTGAWEGYQAMVHVKNVGDRRAGTFDVYVRGEERNELGYYQIRGLTHRVAALNPGQVVSIKSIYFRRPCWIKLSATADAGKTVAESNEANNVARVELKRCNW